jgi:peptidoglycan hydrolase-like protein with peptidoglycan-binding domain
MDDLFTLRRVRDGLRELDYEAGDTSAHVRVVQIKLGVHPATGFFGTKTTAAVKAYQARAHLPVTGVVDHATAVRLGLVRS